MWKNICINIIHINIMYMYLVEKNGTGDASPI